ncbi:MAG: AAA family ATPase [Candidatus Aenigmatarchaeota archaeon]
MVVIGLVGKRYSGKNVFAEYVAKKYGFQLLDFTADVLAPLLKKKGKMITRDNLIELATEMRKRHGNDVLAKLLAKKAKKKNIVISGIRFPEEVTYFKNCFPNFLIVAILAPAKQRWKRRIEAGKGEMKMSFRQFLDIEKRETERHIDRIIKDADLRIKNDGSKKELYLKIDRLINKYLIGDAPVAQW